MNNFLHKIKKISNIFYVRWAVLLFISACAGFGIVGPILHSIDNETVETSAVKKKLPIYCVGTDEKKVAISFDAAWGANRLRKNFKKILLYSQLILQQFHNKRRKEKIFYSIFLNAFGVYSQST